MSDKKAIIFTYFSLFFYVILVFFMFWLFNGRSFEYQKSDYQKACEDSGGFYTAGSTFTNRTCDFIHTDL